MKLALAVALASLSALPLSAQQSTVQMQCHTLASSNNYLASDETYVNGMACKPAQGTSSAAVAPVQAASFVSAPTPAPAPASAPVPAPTAPVVSAPAPPPATPVVSKPEDGKVRLFVTDEPKDESIFLAAHQSGWHANAQSASGGSAGAAYGYSEKGADPRTVELEADLYKVCPSVIVTNDPSRGDFVLLFRRQGGKRSQMFIFGGLTGLAISAHSKVDGASVFNKNGDLVYATRERTVEKAMNEVCGHIK